MRMKKREFITLLGGALSFDHLVGKSEQLVWNLEAKRLGGLEIDDQIQFGRLNYRQAAL